MRRPPSLCFFCLPTCPRMHSLLQALDRSSHLRRRLLVAARDHGFVDGAAHARPPATSSYFRQSPWDTTVFFLQTSATARVVGEELLAQIELALASCTPPDAELEKVSLREIVERGSQQRRRAKKRQRAEMASGGAPPRSTCTQCVAPSSRAVSGHVEVADVSSSS